MRQSKLLVDRPSEIASRDLLAVDRKQSRLVTGLLTGYLNIAGLSEIAMFRIFLRGGILL
jgi:hypothetical protein